MNRSALQIRESGLSFSMNDNYVRDPLDTYPSSDL